MRSQHLILGALAVWSVVAPLNAGSAPSAPNIVMILADDLGWVDTAEGATNFGNGNRFTETPNIQRMAREGMSFTRAYTCPNCAPTRGMMLSGQYMTRTRIYNVNGLNRGTGTLLGADQNLDVASSKITVAETLKSAGYTTAHFGKFHVGDHEGGAGTLPLGQGFDFNFGGTNAGTPGDYFSQGTNPNKHFHDNRVGPELDAWVADYAQSFIDGFITYSADGVSSGSFQLPASLIGSDKHLGDAMSQAAVEFIQAHKDDANPFYMQFHSYLIHSPNQSRPDLLTKYQSKPHPPGDSTSAFYAGMTEQMNQQVGRILRTLTDPNSDGDESDSIAANTLVIFTSDNGGDGRTSNSPLRGNKGMFTEGGVRVPMIAWMPGTIAADTVSDQLLNAVDYYPTFAEFAGASLPNPSTHPLDGVSLKGVLTGENPARDRGAIFWHFPGYLDTRAAPTSVAAKDIDFQGDVKHFKLLYFYEDQHYELYNISDDIGEDSDLLDTPGERETYADIAAELSELLRNWLDDTGAIYPLFKTGPNTGQEVPPPTPLAGSSGLGQEWRAV